MAEKPGQTMQEFTRGECIEEVAQIMSIRARGAVPMACVRIYDCQQNAADGEKIEGQLEQMGLSFTEDEDETDLTLFNTCVIRKHTEDRMFGNVGVLKNIKRRNPSLVAVVCSCMMGQEHMAEHMKKNFPFVNLVFGTHVTHKLPELIFCTPADGRRMLERSDDSEGKTVVEGLPIQCGGSFKAWVTVMYGYNNFYSYCIVSYVRGRECSRRLEAVPEEVRSLTSAGYRGITPLEQNANSYDRELTPAISSTELPRQLDAVDGDFQLRFMMSRPKDATHKPIDTIVQSRHISHHLHLSFQLGSSQILETMNRSCAREKYLGLVVYTKEKISDLSLVSDTIVGFPDETYEESCETVGLIKEMKSISLFTFTYLSRIGAHAAELPDPVSCEERSRWFCELLVMQEEIAVKYCAEMVGTVQWMPAEEGSSKTSHLAGCPGGNTIIEFSGGGEKIGKFYQVRVMVARNRILNGELA